MISERDASFIYSLFRIGEVCDCIRDMLSDHDEDTQCVLAEVGYHIGYIQSLCDTASDELKGYREKTIQSMLERAAKDEERQKRTDELEKQAREMTEGKNGEAGA